MIGFLPMVLPLLAILPLVVARKPLELASLAGILGSAVAILSLVLSAFPPGNGALDGFSRLGLPLIGMLSAATLLVSPGFLNGLPLRDQRRYFLWTFLFISMLFLVAASPNLGLLWVGIEATTLTSAPLVAFYRRRESYEAAWKYLIICSVGLALSLVGLVLLYAASRQVLGSGLAALDWRSLMTVGHRLNPGLLRLSFLFFLVGYGTKAGLAPMHAWLPDAHSEAPAPISGLLSGGLLALVLLTLERIALVAGASTGLFPFRLLLFFGLFSMGLALSFLLYQQDLKRLLAYSSVEQMGLIATAFGLHSALALDAAFLQVLAHGLTKWLAFVGAGGVVEQFGTKKLQRLRGALSTRPGVVFALALLALVGMPPFPLFPAELAILLAAARGGHPWVLALLVLFLTGAFAGLLFFGSRLLLGEGAPAHPAHGLPVLLGVSGGVLAALLALGLFPGLIDPLWVGMLSGMGGVAWS